MYNFPDGKNSDGLKQLEDGGYLTDKRVFKCPADDTKYYYLGSGLNSGNLADPLSIPVVICNDHDGKYINVLYAAGHVRGFKTDRSFYSVRDMVEYVFDQENTDRSSKAAQIVLNNADYCD